jgi:predicted dehydrogenase
MPPTFDPGPNPDLNLNPNLNPQDLPSPKPHPSPGPVRTALVGCGKVGRIHAEALRSRPESVFVGVCDAIPERAAAFGQAYGVPAYTDLGALLSETGAEVVLIGTPHPLHAAAALRAIAAGAHVLIEKPLAASLADCDAILDAASRAGVRVGVISQRRWYEPVLRMKQAIEAGRIGRPILGTFAMLSWRDEAYYRSDPWRGRWDTEGGGVLINQSPHMIDLLVWLMGEPVVEVYGAWANLNHPSVEVEDTAVATLRFRGGGLGSIVASLSQKPGIHTKVHIHGHSGASVGVETDRGATFIAGVTPIAEPPLNDLWTIPGEEDQLDAYREEDRRRFTQIDAINHYHALQIADFLAAVRESRPPLVTGDDGRRVVALIDAIYRSGRERRPIPIEDPAPAPAPPPPRAEARASAPSQARGDAR